MAHQPAPALEGLPVSLLREVTSHLLMHDKRNLWLISTDMYAKRDLSPHSSETDRAWFVEDALEALRGPVAADIMVEVNFPDNKAVCLTFAAGLFSLDLCDLSSVGNDYCGPTHSGKYGRYFVKPPAVLASKCTCPKEQVLLWFAASPNEQWSVVHYAGIQGFKHGPYQYRLAFLFKAVHATASWLILQ